MIDVQSRRDRRKIDIKKVGVKGIQYPIIVQDRANGIQHVNATVKPDPEIAARYEAQYQKFVKIYPAVKEIFPQIG